MLRLICNNTIGAFNFTFVSEIEIVSTWENLTDTCTITIPKKLRLKSPVNNQQSDVITNGVNQLWKRLDPVKIQLGYAFREGNGNAQIINTVFTGNIIRIYPNRPLVFECEDTMIWMKYTSVLNYGKKGVSTMAAILAEIITPAIQQKYGFTLSIEPIQVVNFTLKGAVTIAEVLEYFRKLFGVSAYFKNGVLNVGFAYKLGRNQAVAPVATFDNNLNIIENNLDFMRADDVLIKVQAINFNKDNTKNAPVIVGDAFGELRTVYTYDKNVTDVTNIANQYLYKFKYAGFRGSFVTFLLPQVQQGDSVKLNDDLIPDGNGTYLVKKVITRFGMGGGRQEIFLDQKIA